MYMYMLIYVCIYVYVDTDTRTHTHTDTYILPVAKSALTLALPAYISPNRIPNFSSIRVIAIVELNSYMECNDCSLINIILAKCWQTTNFN